MIPHFKYTVIRLGVIHIQVWGLFVAMGIILALAVGLREARRRGLDQGVLTDFTTWLLIPALIFARLFHAFAYEPADFLGDPFKLFRLWEGGMSSFGGFFGAAIGAWLFVKLRKVPFAPYADVAAYVLPLGYGCGRIGCFLIHDHPGTLSNSLLAVEYPGGPRLDHGLLLSMLGFGIFVFFWLLKRGKPHPVEKGFLPLFMIIYGVARFFLDFWRAWDLPGSDIRYFGLTPAQYGSLLFVVAGTALYIRYRKSLPPALAVGMKK